MTILKIILPIIQDLYDSWEEMLQVRLQEQNQNKTLENQPQDQSEAEKKWVLYKVDSKVK